MRIVQLIINVYVDDTKESEMSDTKLESNIKEIESNIKESVEELITNYCPYKCTIIGVGSKRQI